MTTPLPVPLNVPNDRSRHLNGAFPVYRKALNNPIAPALVVDGCTYTYGELAEWAGRVATWLHQNAPVATHQSRVGVLTARSIETYVGILGACWSGACYVPINTKLPRERLEHILQSARLNALIVDEAGLNLVRQVRQELLPKQILKPFTSYRVQASTANSALQDSIPLQEPVAVNSEDCAYVMFTSGTTGTPKGVMVSTGNLRAFLDRTQEIYHLNENDRISQFSEVSFDFSVLDLFAAWDAGATLYTVPDNMLMAPARFIQENELTFWASVPSVITFLDRLKLLKPGAFPSLRTTYFCGEPLALASALAWQQAAPNSVIDNHYGPTEATVACSFERLRKDPNITQERGIIAIGPPYAHMHMAVLDEEGSFLPPGTPGELALHGDQVAIGYMGDPETTQRRFRKLCHPRLGLSTWYLTGDKAREDSTGCFHHLGRIDHQVKVFGHRIELEEVDAHLRKACGSDLAITVAWPVKHGTAEGLVAFVGGGGLEAAHILSKLKQSMPAYMLPQRIITLDGLPLTPNGKIDRRTLAESLK